MDSTVFDKIIKEIDIRGWFYFGKEDFECPGFSDQILTYYLGNNRLPDPCNNCYKALIFWGKFDNENITNFLKLISSFEINYRGKFNQSVAVFYFRDKNKMLGFLDFLGHKMSEYNVKGGIQWRRACKEFQDQRPKLWKNAKEFIPDPNG